MKTLAAIIAILFIAGNAKAVILVEDIPNLANNIASEAKNIVQFVETTLNTVTIIENQITQLERFGDPGYYVNLLHLDGLFNTVTVLKEGIGEVIADYRNAANGFEALGYTGNGIYANLQGRLDRFGNPVMYNYDSFKKFGTVNNMIESYNVQQNTYNQQVANLQQQLATALDNLNGDSTQMGTEKYSAQANAIAAQLNALGHTTNLTGQRMQIQQYSNQNDAARVQEADRQQEIQERKTDLENTAVGFSTLIGGGQ